MSKIQGIKSKILGKKKEYNLLDIWHHLMIHYGWIPFEEFKKLDASIVNELVKKLNKMNEEQNKQRRRR